MKKTVFHACFILIALLAVIGLAQQPGVRNPRPMRLDDLGRIVRVFDPQISPDGKSIVIVVAQGRMSRTT